MTCLYPEQLLKVRWSQHHPLASAWDRLGLPSLYASCPPHRTDVLGVALAPRGAGCLDVNTNLPQDPHLQAHQHLRGEGDSR